MTEMNAATYCLTAWPIVLALLNPEAAVQIKGQERAVHTSLANNHARWLH